MKEDLCLNGNQYTVAPESSPSWIQTDSRQQREMIEAALDTHVEFVDLFIQSLSDNGRDLYVGSRRPLDTGERGGILLDLERRLIARVDPGLRVWFEVTADKSKLRQLRGVSPVLTEGDKSQ